jgi:predicted amidohydrolase
LVNTKKCSREGFSFGGKTKGILIRDGTNMRRTREANLARAKQKVKEAAQKGCQIIVLPECMDLGWTFPKSRELAQPIPGRITSQIADWARSYNIYIVAGITERSGDLVYNAAVLLDPQGKILLTHRKINELDIAHSIYSLGDRLGVASTALGIIGLDICADNFSNSLVLGHSICRMGAQIIVSPSAWAVDANHNQEKHPYGKTWIKSYATLAKLYKITVVGVSNVGWMTEGPWKGKKCIGCSLAVGPDGKIIARGSYGEDAEELVIVPINLMNREARGTSLISLIHKRGYKGP